MARSKSSGVVSQRGESAAKVADRLLAEADYLTDDADGIFQWNGRHWVELSKARLRQIALHADGWLISDDKRRREIIEQLKARSHRPGHAWGRVAPWEIACENGVVDVRSGMLRPHRPDDYLERVVPWEWAPGAKAPRWQKALGEWFPDEGNEVPSLQEFFAYAGMQHALYKRALVLYSEKGDTGKSAVLAALRAFVGERNCCALPLEKMDDPVARAILVGRSLNVMTEISEDAVIADGGFKTLVSTEEAVLINQKYKEPFTYVPHAKHVFATNNLPRVTDQTETVLNRLLIIPFRRQFARAEQDRELQAALKNEMQGILLWAIEGGRRLVAEHGQFSIVDAGERVIQQLRLNANAVIPFLMERCEIDEEGALPLSRLATVFNRWHAGSRKVTANGLGRMLRKAGHVTKDVRVPLPGSNGKRTRTLKSLVGFRLLEWGAPLTVRVGPGALTSPADEVEGTVDKHEPPDGGDL